MSYEITSENNPNRPFRTCYVFKFTWDDLSNYLGTSVNTLKKRNARWKLNLKTLSGLQEFIRRSQALNPAEREIISPRSEIV